MQPNDFHKSVREVSPENSVESPDLPLNFCVCIWQVIYYRGSYIGPHVNR